METVRWDTLQTVVLLWLLLLFPGEALQTTDLSTDSLASSSSSIPPRGNLVSSTLIATAPSGYYPRGTGVGSWLELGLFGTHNNNQVDAAARSGRSYVTEATTDNSTTQSSGVLALSFNEVWYFIIALLPFIM